MTSQDADILTNQDRMPNYVSFEIRRLCAAPQEFWLLHFSGTIFRKGPSLAT